MNSRTMVPVIGNDLSIIRMEKEVLSKSDNYPSILKNGVDEGEYLRINLYKYLAFRLWDIFGKGDMPVLTTINRIVLNLQENGILENEINNAVKNEISCLTDDQIQLEPYRKLVRLSGFETFLTVNIDNFLERAFEAEQKHVNKSFNFSIPVPAVSPQNQRDMALPRIYNLMGNIEGYNFALLDEQSLEYLYMLLYGSDTVAKDIFETINQKNILFIGTSYPDWFMRFFIRIISKERFKYSVKTKYVACDNTFQDSELINFLENNALKVIPINTKEQDVSSVNVYKNSIEFLDRMFEESDQSNTRKRNEVRYKEALFISYSWNDKTSAEKLKNEFEKNGLHVFFDDDDLKTGDQYNKIIKDYIKTCDYFLAIISNNSIGDKNRYVYEKEWQGAIFIDDKDHSNIRPFIIDDTLPTDPRIPEEIRNLNIEKITSFDDLPKVIRKFISENKLTPITA